ncbi:MAG: MBOAT family protein [Clostridiales bacterium]|nr:MBOAT family protein [Clostridiales bacterium]
MLFSSLIFLVVFLPCALMGYYGIALIAKLLSRKNAKPEDTEDIIENRIPAGRKLQNIFLLVASLGFYAWGEPWFVLVMMLSILGNWIFGLLVNKFRESKTSSRAVIIVMLVFNLSIIFIFKYLCFTLEQINSITKTEIAIPDIALPIGISFFTFQAISYVIDVYREKGEMQKNLLNVGLYISFFPQLIAGPIVRYETISDQINNRRESWDDFAEGTCRFVIGLSKKVLLSNNFALIANQAFSYDAADACSILFAWLGAIAYTLQIYFDFSGYSDMAIGLGKMFGFHFLENFNYPYISLSVSEFWRRWHISLGSWFRDYVYFPLGGSRVDTKARLVFNLFVVWFLTGVWHGANWTFISWGLMYFVLISIEKVSGFEKKRIPGAVKWLYTMLFVVIGWVFFRANSMADGLHYVKTMFFLNIDAPLICNQFTVFFRENIYYLIAGIFFSMPVTKWLRRIVDEKTNDGNPVIAGAYTLLLTAGLIFSMAYLIKGAYNPFIYFNF